jgi:hypothetical protein
MRERAARLALAASDRSLRRAGTEAKKTDVTNEVAERVESARERGRSDARWISSILVLVSVEPMLAPAVEMDAARASPRRIFSRGILFAHAHPLRQLGAILRSLERARVDATLAAPR